MSSFFDRWTTAWLVTCLTFAIHIADEAYHGSFGFYADMASLITSVMPSLEVPPFRYEVWLINLVGALAVLLALTPLVRARRSLMIAGSYLLAAFVTSNAALHLYMAITMKALVPGLYTAPLMLAAGLFLFSSVSEKGSGTTAAAA